MEGGHKKQYVGGNCLKRGLGQFAGGLATKRGEGVFEGGGRLIPDAHYDLGLLHAGT